MTISCEKAGDLYLSEKAFRIKHPQNVQKHLSLLNILIDSPNNFLLQTLT